MAATWQNTATTILREIIGDVGNVLTYGDHRLEQVLVTSANFINQELVFSSSYTIDVELITITPDPVSVPDNNFINLMCLKAACVLAGAEQRLATNKAFGFKDGPSSIDGKPHYEAVKQWAKDICGQYQKAVRDHKLGHNISGHLIVSPGYRTSAVTPSHSENQYRDRNEFFG